jgi:predicted nuclease of predicted toxin-antitoxin system
LRVLLDENVDRRLKRTFDEQHEVSTVPERGWAGKKNSELLEAAGKEFDALVTTDRGIPHQQNLSRLDLAVIVLEAKSNSYEDFPSLMDRTTFRFFARTTAGSARTLHQPDKMRFEETHAPFPMEHLTTLTTYLTTYP